MATHALPTPHKRLKKVILLTKQLESCERSLRLKLMRRIANRRKRKYECHTEEERRVFNDSLIRLGVEIRVLEEKISSLKIKLEKLPKLCRHCKGNRLIVEGALGMTDSICPICCGDGLDDGPNQQVRRKEIAEMFKKMRDQIHER